MPASELTKRQYQQLELALVIEDPAGVEQLDLAELILEIFSDRSARQCELMRQSLWRWSQQWPRNCPPTERNPPSLPRTSP